uniref:Lipoprotein n=1 Tax=Thermus tengchongensis TaxID=1214928 RepID=A0A7V4ANW5_9DEIN
MKRLVLLLMSLALAACSGHTIYRFEVNLLSFIPQNQRQGELNLTTSQILFPDDPAGQLVEVPGAEALVDGRLYLETTLKNTGTVSSTLDIEVHLGPGSDTDLYDGQGGDFTLIQQSITLNPGEERAVSVPLDVQPGTQAFDLIKAGKFRLGARLSLSGERVQCTLNQAEIVLRLKLFNLIPNP